jgi:hypothetical protein
MRFGNARRKKPKLVHKTPDRLLRHPPDWPEDGRMARSLKTPVESVRKWHSLAERRRRYFVELYRSERWKRYYTEEEFRSHMRDVDENVEMWEQVLHRTAGGPAPQQ